MASDVPAEWMAPDGGLLNNGMPFVHWQRGMASVVLDGDFEAADLRAIADWIDQHSTQAEAAPIPPCWCCGAARPTDTYFAQDGDQEPMCEACWEAEYETRG